MSIPILLRVSQPYQILFGDKKHKGTLKRPLVRTGVSVTPLFPIQATQEERKQEGRKEGKKEGEKEGR